MQLTRFTDYGLRILTFLAVQPEGQQAKITDIAKTYDISRNHVVKIVHALGKSGFIHTTRGRSGGICLSRDPEQLSIGDVVRYLEPKAEIVNRENPLCKLSSICQLRPILDEAVEAFYKVLDQYTLADLVSAPKRVQKVLFLNIA